MTTDGRRNNLIGWTFAAWFDRETALPLTVGTAVGLLLCVVVVPASARALLSTPLVEVSWQPMPRDDESHPAPPVNRSDQVMLGDDEPNVARVAWISHNDYRRMVAPRGRAEQPSVQKTAKPVTAAPHRLDATAPGAAAKTPRPTVAARRRRPPRPKLPRRPDGTLARAQPDDTPQAEDAKTPAAKEAAPGQPTAAARSDREASPVSLRTDSVKVRAGRVITAEGIRIQTVAPRITAVTYLSAMRGGVRMPVRVMFDLEGRVTKAQLRKRTGYHEVDNPILASLFQWRAGGEKLAEMERPFEISILLEIGGAR